MTALRSKGFCSQNTQRASSWTNQFLDPDNRFPSCLSIAGDGATGVGGAPHPAGGQNPSGWAAGRGCVPRTTACPATSERAHTK